ncbi:MULTISPECIES: hypothetical protein [Rhodococcus]|nr:MULTISPECIES: hypothetical protein [Rhodococcus]MDF3311914.1 hypothetical protein [Rhodococcus sp. T2V]
MAAESLEQGAARSGHEIHVETQGASGSEPRDPAVIAAADGRDLRRRHRLRPAGRPRDDQHLPRMRHASTSR